MEVRKTDDFRLVFSELIVTDKKGNHTLILKKGGELWAYGFNYSGQIGVGNQEHVYKFLLPLLSTKKQN